MQDAPANRLPLYAGSPNSAIKIPETANSAPAHISSPDAKCRSFFISQVLPKCLIEKQAASSFECRTLPVFTLIL